MSIVFLQKHFPHFVLDMQNAQHHYDWENLSPHHLEGDVWAHQMMVSAQCRNRNFDKFVEVAAICHDLGKPACREVDDEMKKVRFHGHSGVGVFMAAEVLKKMKDEDFIEWFLAGFQFVLELVSWHQDLFSEIGEDEKLKSKVMSRFAGQSMDQFSRLLQLMICDGNGRFTTTYRAINKEKLLMQHWEASKAFNETQQTRMNNIHMGNQKLHILIGPPLSGKSTWRKENLGDAFVISRDDMLMTMAPGGMSYNEAWNYVNQKEIDLLLNEKWKLSKRELDSDIVVDMTNMSRKSRRRWLSGLPRSMETHAVVFATPLSILNERNFERSAEGKWIPPEVIMSMLKKFSAPTLDEFDTVDWVL